MALIIDGYNLLHATNILGRGGGPGAFERSRTALLNVLAQSIPPEEIPRTTIVFDAKDPPWGLARQIVHQGITVHFASKHEDADSLIEELILADSAPKRLTVVSSDHRLHHAAKRRKATPVDSDRWFAELMRNRKIDREVVAGEPPAKPEGPYTSGEIEFWLREFGEQ